MYALRGITLQCNTQRVWICALVVMTRARKRHNSIPITLVGTVLHVTLFQVSGHISFTAGEGILLIDSVVTRRLVFYGFNIGDARVTVLRLEIYERRFQVR